MLLQPTPAPSFDDPLAMLRACHGRIQAQCATLRKLQAHLPTHGCDTQAQQAAQAVLRYFDTAGQHHHEDEEHDLFPRLRATGNAKATALITRLLAEHETMTAAWQRLRPQLLALAEARATTLDAEIMEGFIASYASHIETENGTLLPLADQLLSPADLAAIGANMAKRRGVALSLN